MPATVSGTFAGDSRQYALSAFSWHELNMGTSAEEQSQVMGIPTGLLNH